MVLVSTNLFEDLDLISSMLSEDVRDSFNAFKPQALDAALELRQSLTLQDHDLVVSIILKRYNHTGWIETTYVTPSPPSSFALSPATHK